MHTGKWRSFTVKMFDFGDIRKREELLVHDLNILWYPNHFNIFQHVSTYFNIHFLGPKWHKVTKEKSISLAPKAHGYGSAHLLIPCAGGLIPFGRHGSPRVATLDSPWADWCHSSRTSATRLCRSVRWKTYGRNTAPTDSIRSDQIPKIHVKIHVNPR